jgi:hypothetical protein
MTAADTTSPRTQQSAISWPAVLGGAVAAAALSLMLIVIGTGLGFASVSPWPNSGIDSRALDIATVAWIVVTPTVASVVGGYLCGRLRTRWLQTHTHEVRFRDGAHGFLTWAIATVGTVALVSSTFNSINQSSTPLSMVQDLAIPPEYYVGKLFRKVANASIDISQSQSQTQSSALVESTRIFSKSLSTGQVAKDDLLYLTQQIKHFGGISEQEADKRLRDTFSDAQAQLEESTTMAQRSFDQARKRTAYASMWFFISLLCGATAASSAAIIGGQRRDKFE